MRRVYLKNVQPHTPGGFITVSMQELDFLYHLTDKKTPQEAIELFAIVCLTHFKDPQETLKALNISPMGGNVLFMDEAEAPQSEDPQYQRFIYEVTVKNG